MALDTDDRDLFDRWCRELGPRVGALKVGLEAFVRWGQGAVEEARKSAKSVFLDLKLHDIPNTVAGAVRAARGMGIRYLTVHAGGGPAMLEAAVEAAAGEVQLLGVTLLTHLDRAALDALDLPGEASKRAEGWAVIAQQAGCAGVVCSPRELPELRPRLPSPFQLVTPGIRPAGADHGDQRRVSTPEEALRDGADLLVVGRPITAAPEPLEALETLFQG